MAELQTLARPYARAAFTVAREAKALADWGTVLERLAQAARDEKMASLIGHPAVPAQTLVDMLSELAKAGDGAVNLLRVLAENRRLGLLPAIAEEFAQLRNAYEQLCQVDIRSASELAEAQRDGFTAALKKRLGAEVSVQWTVDPELIGGAVVAAGDLVIDGSVQGELNRLRAGLTQ